MAHSLKPNCIVLSEKELSAYIRISTPCLKHWRSIGYGPSFFKVKGKAVRYELPEVMAWIESCVVDPGTPEEEADVVDGVFEIRVYGAR